MTSLSRRINLLILDYGLNISKFEKSIDASNGTISKAIKEDRDINSSLLIKIKEVYPDVNLDWLITGKGSIKSTLNNAHLNSDENAHLNAHLNGKSDIKRGLVSEVINVPLDANGYAPLPPAIAGNKWVPLVGISATAGYLEYFQDMHYVQELHHLSISNLPHGRFTAFEVLGDSMEPTIRNKDILIGKHVQDMHEIRDRQVCIICTSTSILVKRVVNRLTSNISPVLECWSDNDYYPMFEVSGADIRQIMIVHQILTYPSSNTSTVHQDAIKRLEDEVAFLRQLVAGKNAT